MAISEEKMKIVIENYFRDECNINTTIHDAFEKGFRIGVNKAIPKQESERKSRDHFERLLHDMFDDMWDDEIEHPRYQDTVGDLMAAVLVAFDKTQPEEIIRCSECIHSSHEPHGDSANVYVCNYNHWRRSEGGRYPDDYCSQAERRTGCA